MSEFHLFYRLGIDHVADVNNHHHIFFLVSLFVIYSYPLWTKILLLLIAFTIGHGFSVLHALSGIHLIPGNLIEFVIPLLILSSSLVNFQQKSDKFNPGIFKIKCIIITIFGLIHGMGFYHDLVKIPGTRATYAGPLFSYNLGVETAQLAIVIIILILSLLFTDLMKIKRREWIMILSGVSSGAAIVMMIEHFPW